MYGTLIGMTRHEAPRSGRLRWPLWAATGWVTAVVVASLQDARPHVFARTSLHRQMHWLVFGLTAAVLCASLRTRRQRLLVGLLLSALGLAIEYAQHRLYHTALDWRDVADNTVVSVAVCLAAVVLETPRVRRDR